MANKYAVTGQENAVTSALTTALDLVGSTTSRPEIYYFTASAEPTMADATVRVAVMDHTTANTMTAVTPTKIDPAALAVVATAGENASAEGTYTAGSEKYDQNIHLRSQAYWWANYETDRLIVPAAANNGIGLRVLSTTFVGAYDATIHFLGV
jgi:hypothetical protein